MRVVIRSSIAVFGSLVIAVCLCGPLVAQAVRVLNGNVCGSGSVCGYDNTGAYVLTNAHVAGTRPGATMKVEYDFGAGRSSAEAAVVFAAYSDRTLSDWAILRVGSLKSGPRWVLSTSLPTGSQFLTCGAPRCVWPLVCGEVRSVDVGTVSPLWRWLPNSIGGQSGSSVRTADGVTKGLLTWSWGGYGAGQTTAAIYKSLVNKSVDNTIRPAGLVEVSGRACTEVGFFSEVGAADLPIWDTSVPPPPPPSDELKSRVESAGVSWSEFTAAVLSLLNLFGH